MAKSKKGTPAWVDRLLSFRKEITEDEYTYFWKRLNKVRNDREAWNEEGQKIIREIESEKKQPLFRRNDFDSLSSTKRAAELYRSDHGGRIVRRDSRGRFSSRGRTFQVIGTRKK